MVRNRILHGSWGLLVVLLAGAWFVLPVTGAHPETIWAGEPSRHSVALTFDDGPSPRYTPKILALLKQYQAKATFFVMGAKVEKYPQLIKVMLRDGHEVGNHSFTHPRLTETSQLVRERELERTRLDLDLLGCPKEHLLIRPPYSAYDDQLVSYLTHTQRELVLWSIDSGDWRGLKARAVARNVLARVRNGSIVVFHDSDEKSQEDRSPTVTALKVILPALQALGYRMVTISELVECPKD